jgi:hypothetical protein
MRHALTVLLSAASLCAVAGTAPAVAQMYGPAPGYGYGTPWPYPLQSTYAGPYATAPSHTATPAYSWHRNGPYPAVTGSCDIIAGNRICSAAPAGGYAYGYGPGGPVGAMVAAPFDAAGAVFAAPFGARGAIAGPPVVAASGETIAPLTGTPAYSYESHVGPQPAVVGHCDLISGNRICVP